MAKYLEGVEARVKINDTWYFCKIEMNDVGRTKAQLVTPEKAKELDDLFPGRAHLSGAYLSVCSEIGFYTVHESLIQTRKLTEATLKEKLRDRAGADEARRADEAKLAATGGSDPTEDPPKKRRGRKPEGLTDGAAKPKSIRRKSGLGTKKGAKTPHTSNTPADRPEQVQGNERPLGARRRGRPPKIAK